MLRYIIISANRASKTFFRLLALLIICSLLFTVPVTPLPIEQTISRRQSIRSYTSENITSQQLLQILWAAYGYSSPGYRTTPSISGSYPLIIYPVNATGSYRYFPENHSVALHRSDVNKETIRPHDQNWPSDASVVLVIVWNRTIMGNGYFAWAEAGCLVQNVYLEANALDLGTCCVGGIDPGGLKGDLHLTSDLTVLLVMPISYPKVPYPAAAPNYDLMTGNLPPVQYSESSLEESLINIRSVTAWSPENLSLQELSQVLWAAYGYTNVSKKESYHRTTPSAYDKYPLIIFLSNSSGVYEYLPGNHSVTKILDGDKRNDIAGACSNQTWAASAPAIFIIVYDSEKGSVPWQWIEVDAGCVIQEFYLEATAWNLGTNVIGDGLEQWNGTGAAELRDILGLPSTIVPLYVMPVGHPTVRVEDLVIRTVSEAGQVSNTDPWTEYYANASVTTQGSFNDLLNITWVFNCAGTGEDANDDVRSHYTFKWTPDEGFTEPTLTGYLINGDCVNASLSASSGWFRLAFRFGKSADPTTWTCKVTAYLNTTNFGFRRSSQWTMNTYIGFTLSPNSVYWTGYPGNINISANSMPLNITVSSNVNINIRVRGGVDLTTNGNTIPLSNVYVSQSGSPSNNDGITLTTSYQDWKTGIPPSEGTDHSSYWFLTIPEGTPAGTYTFTFYIEASRS